MEHNYINSLHKAIKYLASSQDINELCHHAVNNVLNEFNMDRSGVLLFDEEANEQQGTWGTDAFGQLRDERHLRLPVTNDLIQHPEQADDGMIVNRDAPLQELGKDVGRGWHIQCGVFDHDKLLGWLFVDNLVHGRPLEDGQIDLIRAYAGSFGQMLVKFRQNQMLRDLNKNLEKQNDYLEKALDSLANAQERLVEGKKMASLGRLVQGVAHELNTPLGNARMAVSEVTRTVLDQQDLIDDNKLTLEDAIAAHGTLSIAANLAETNIKRAGDLVSQFKQIAVSEEHDKAEHINVHKFMTQLISSMRELLPALAEVDIQLECINEDLEWNILPGAYSQAFTHLLSNAVQHGLKEKPNSSIRFVIDTKTQNHQTFLKVSFSDNGVGVDDETLRIIFDPFYTSNRQTGSGLGASIVYNLVTHRMNGSIQAKHNPGGGLLFELLLPENLPEHA